MIGQTIDCYKVLEKRGEGGMGVLYKAWEEGLDRSVALKTLHPDLISDPEFREKLGREAKSLARLNHPNIVTIFRYLVHEGSHFIVMEYVEGRTVAEVIADWGPYSFSDAARIMVQMLDALGYAHKNGVVHRDIKPSNILLTGDGVVKVTDFGIAKLLDTEKTRTIQGAGSLFYMAPEQIQHGDVDGRTDIYAAGVTLFEMLTGTVPFTAETEFLIMKKHIEEPPPAPSSFKTTITGVQDELVLHAMEKDPARRFPTAEDFANAVRDALSFSDTGAGILPPKESKGAPRKEKTPTRPRSAEEKTARKKSKAIWVYLVVAVFAAVAGYLALRPTPEPATRGVAIAPDTAKVEEAPYVESKRDTVTEQHAEPKKPEQRPELETLTGPALTVDIEPFNQRARVTGVWVDNHRVADSAPFDARGLTRGLHWVKIETPYGTLADTVFWTGDGRQVSFFLSESYGRLRISAEFSDGENFADIFVDDRDIGRGTPYEIRDLLVGPHKIEVRKEGYRAVDGPRVARVAPTGTNEVPFRMQPR